MEPNLKTAVVEPDPDAMEQDVGVKLPSLKVDGGMTKNNLLMQFQSDLIDCPMTCPQMPETTAIGSAYAAALAVGFYTDIEDVRGNWQLDKQWEPSMVHAEREGLVRNWRKAVARAAGWLEGDSEQCRSANDKLISGLQSSSGKSEDVYTFSIGKRAAWTLIITAAAGAALVALKAGTMK